MPGPRGVSALDSAGSGTINVATVDVLMVAAPEPEQPGEAHEAKETYVEAIVIVRVDWSIRGVLGRSLRRRGDACHADEKE